MKLAKCGCLYEGAVQMCPLHAAAPDLLEACKATLDFVETRFYAGRDNGRVAAQLQRAIIKAEQAISKAGGSHD